MMFNCDRRLIEILNSLGVVITWEDFRRAYDMRRSERFNRDR